jgi:hypothetical protein
MASESSKENRFPKSYPNLWIAVQNGLDFRSLDAVIENVLMRAYWHAISAGQIDHLPSPEDARQRIKELESRVKYAAALLVPESGANYNEAHHFLRKYFKVGAQNIYGLRLKATYHLGFIFPVP